MLEMKLELETKEYLEAKVYLQKCKKLGDLEFLDKNGVKIENDVAEEFKNKIVKHIIFSNGNIKFKCRPEDRDFIYRHTVKFMNVLCWDTCYIITPWQLLKSELTSVYDLDEVTKILDSSNTETIEEIVKKICNILDDDAFKLLGLCYTRANIVILNQEQQQNALLATIQNCKYTEYIDMITSCLRQFSSNQIIKFKEYNGFENTKDIDVSIAESNDKELLFNILKIRANYFRIVESEIKSINTQFVLAAQKLVDLRILTILYDSKKEYVTTMFVLKELGMKKTSYKGYKEGLDSLVLKYKVLTNDNLMIPLVIKKEKKSGNNYLYKLNSFAINVLEENDGEIIYK